VAIWNFAKGTGPL